MAAFSEWGAQCLDRFRGMFSFAIWDCQKKELFAARDLFGEKPLYYAPTGDGGLVLASEIKAILASGEVSPELDKESVDAFLAFGYVPPDRTIYRNVQTLAPGSYLIWRPEGTIVRRYWRPRFNTQSVTMDEAAHRLRELLEQAVQRQMVADVPVGAFLSGGHDSSTVVAMMSNRTSAPIKTFSVGFGKYINELPFARQVAQRYRTEHYAIDLGMPPVGEMLEKMADVYDEPFRDPSHIPTYLISKFASQEVKVVLTGDGADELFGGYAWYPVLAESTEVSTTWLKWLILRSISKLIGDRARNLNLHSRALGLALRHPETFERHINGVTVDSEIRASWWGDHADSAISYMPGNYYRPIDNIMGMDQVYYFDLLSFLPGDILVKVDRAAMANSLETRAPFLDRDLVEFALSLPTALKVKKQETKILFKKAYSTYWPKELHKRAKQGFAGPYSEWLTLPDVKDRLQRLFSEGSALRNLLPGVTEEQQYIRNYQTWNLMTLGIWLERNKLYI
jgi:asparagine synthase (glutamine-hydrolysing)